MARETMTNYISEARLDHTTPEDSNEHNHAIIGDHVGDPLKDNSWSQTCEGAFLILRRLSTACNCKLIELGPSGRLALNGFQSCDW